MGWLKLFALLVAVASVQITAEGPKKKIRIHLPQKVKHIHHHKKIYITNHPAPSQYAPAYLPGVKGAVALPSNIGRPSVAGLGPYNGVYEQSRGRLPVAAPSASKLLPLYHGRHHYGPHPSSNDWEDQDFDVASPADASDSYYSSGYSDPAPSPAAPIQPPKRVKIIKVNDLPRKKVIRKVKPKRVVVRGRPQPPPPPPALEDEHPVSSFHEQFYSDLEGAGTIRKIKKPPRIEKIIDGDTEHIHTYSEEHIHKVVFDDEPKVTGVVGVDHIGSMSALTAAHPLVPLKNAQTLVAIPTNSFADLAVVGSMGSPPHMEYAAYNPRDVTHDHIYHDHGEIPSGVDVSKDAFKFPPKVSYNSHGLRISHDYPKRQPGKHTRFYGKHTKPTQDYSYYESIYMPHHKPKNVPKPTLPTHFNYDTSSETNLNDFRPIPAFRFKEKRKIKTRPITSHYGLGNQAPNYQLQQSSAPAPFSMSTTVVHDYAPKQGHRGIGAPAGFSKYRDPLLNFRDSFTNDFDYDTLASSSDVYTSEDKNDASLSLQGKTGKKSVSTQNISFGGQDSQSYVDHLGSSSNAAISEVSPSAADIYNDFEMTTEMTPTPYTIKETSPAHSYYTAMALQALHGDQPEASNDNAQYAEPPSPSPEVTETTAGTTTPTSHTIHFFKIQTTDVTPETNYASENRQNKKARERNRAETNRQRYNAVFKELMSEYTGSERQPARHENKFSYVTDSSSVRGNLKYGDKI